MTAVVSTPTKRAAGHRERVVLKTAALSFLTRGVSVVGSLVTAPIALHALGTERFGVWMAALALSALFAVADGGIANGLVSPVSQAFGRGDLDEVRRLIASGFATSAAFLVIFIPAILFTAWRLDWRWAFNLSSAELGDEAGQVVTILSVAFAIATPASVIRQSRLGMLQGEAVSGWDFLAMVAGLGGGIGALLAHASLPVVALFWAGPPALVRVVAATVFLAGRGRAFAPTPRDLSLSCSRTLLAAGGAFMVMNLTQGLAVQSDQVLIARLIDAGAVTEYAIVQRLFNQPYVIITLILAAQWPAYGEALGRGDHAWIRRHFRKTLVWAAGGATLACGLLAAFCQPILDLWLGRAVVAHRELVVAMAVFGVVAALANVFMFFFLSLRLHRRIVLGQAAMTVLNLALSIWLIPRLGPVGAVIGITCGYLAAILAPSILAIDRLLNVAPGGEVRR